MKLSWKNHSEAELTAKLKDWVSSNARLLQNAILFLEGEMGSGKSTFARVLLSEMVPGFSSQGSPTFPLVQEYQAKAGHPIYHIDLYRLKHEGELEDSGILHQIEELRSLSLVEWPDLFPDVFAYWRDSSRKRAKNIVVVSIENTAISSGASDVHRNYFIEIV